MAATSGRRRTKRKTNGPQPAPEKNAALERPQNGNGIGRQGDDRQGKRRRSEFARHSVLHRVTNDMGYAFGAHLGILGNPVEQLCMPSSGSAA